MGYIPKTTKATVKMFRGLSLPRITIGLIILLVSFSIVKVITSSVLAQLLIIAVIIILYLIMSGKSPSNPKKLFFFGLVDYFVYLITPKKMYGANTEEYREYKESEEKKNVKKRRGKKA